ncbi:hypothetical protein GEMRC1_005516 [Eukaryota sp. GEM-RC1]
MSPDSNCIVYDYTVKYKEGVIPAARAVLTECCLFKELPESGHVEISPSQINVSIDAFRFIIEALHGQDVNLLNEQICCDVYELCAFFQLDDLKTELDDLLYKQSSDSSALWFSKFLMATDQAKRLDMFHHACSYISNMTSFNSVLLSGSYLKLLLPYCSTLESFKWFLRSLATSTLNGNVDKDILYGILNQVDLGKLSWFEFQDLCVTPLRTADVHVDVLNSFCKERLGIYPASYHRLMPKIKKLKIEDHDSDVVSHDTDGSIAFQDSTAFQDFYRPAIEPPINHDSFVFKFSNSDKHHGIELSDHMRSAKSRLPCGSQPFLGDTPLLPGRTYHWTVRYSGMPHNIIVGIIPYSKFKSDELLNDVHGFCTPCYGTNMSGIAKKWLADDLLSISVDLVNFKMELCRENIFKLTSELKELKDDDHYYPYFCCNYADQNIHI